MKKLFAVLIVLLMLMGLCACGGNEESPLVDNDATEEETTDALVNLWETDPEAAELAGVPKPDNNSSEQNQVIPSQETSSVEQKVISHVALMGAVIVRQDGSSKYSYKGKCESCGYISGTVVTDYGSHGKSTRGFTCSGCGNHQAIEIEHYSN